MKKIAKYIVVAVLSACLLPSCSFLKEDPATSLTDVYDSQASLEVAVRGIQNSIANVYNAEYLENLESCSGLMHFGGTSSRIGDNRWQCILDQVTYTSMSLNITMYGSFYTGINRCNVLLDALKTSPVDEAYKKEIEGEAKLYRGILYLGLARLYADVPLVTEGNTSSFKAIGRTNYCEVYAQIVSDFKDAFEMMRSAKRVAEVTGTQGRPQKWAAKAYLAATYLQIASILTVPQDENFYDASKPGRKPDFKFDGIGTDALKAWQLAYDTSKAVIESGEYRLAADFADLYRWDPSVLDAYGKNCWNLDERIVTIQYVSPSTVMQRTLPTFPEGASVVEGTSVSRSGNIRPSRFFFNEWCRRNNGVLGAPDTDMFRVYVSCDDNYRITHSMFINSYIRCDTGKATSVYPATGSMTGRTLPYFCKMNNASYNGNSVGAADFYLMRLAEVYYIAAESAIYLGKKGEATDLVNEVRLRGKAEPWPLDGVSEPTVDDVVWDKLFELGMEGHAFYEVRRYGAKWFVENILKPRNELLQIYYECGGGDYLTTFFGYDTFKFFEDEASARKSLLCEFPKDELTANSAMSLADKNDFSWE